MEQHLSASVVICTRNRVHDITKLLDSLSGQTSLIKEIIVVDSSDEKIERDNCFVQSFSPTLFPNTRLLYMHTEPGLTYQRNCGIAAVTGDVVYFFDDDVVLEPGYIEHMQDLFEENKSCAGAMGSVTNVPTYRFTMFRLFRVFFLLQRIHSSGKFTFSGMPTHTYGTDKKKAVAVLGGCCMAYRSHVFKNQLFDEKLRFYSYMEDCDFSSRVSRSHVLYYNPLARCKHFHSSLNRDKVVHNRAMYIKNYSYLFFKNFYPYNRLSVLGYFWSVLGLFFEAIFLRRDMQYVRGYVQGLKSYVLSRK